MKLSAIKPPPEYGWICCVASENKRWALGVYPVMFGYRVRGCLVNSSSVCIDYCAANQTDFLAELFLVLQLILEQLPEDTTETEMSRLMPGYTTRPINQDACWSTLRNLAIQDQALEKLHNLRKHS
jgi:hypothetical protein